MQTAYRSEGWRYTAPFLLLQLLGAGCSNDADVATGGVEPANEELQVTWHADIAPIVQDKCATCHRDGGIGPFSVEDYASAKDFAESMAKAVENGRMPPFLAQETEDCKPRLPWQADTRLSTEQKALFRTWATSGAPEGAAQKGQALKLEAPPADALEREDNVMSLPEAIAVEGDKDIHTCVVIDPALDHDSYIVGTDIHAGNSKVLHHMRGYVIEPGQTKDGKPRSKSQLEAAIRDARGVGIGGRYDCFGGAGLPGIDTTMLLVWAPGARPAKMPPHSALPIDQDSLVLLDIHYHASGEPEMDSDTKVSLMLTDERPDSIAKIVLLGNAGEAREIYPDGISELVKQPGESVAEFVIPAGESDHVEDMSWTFNLPEQARLKIYAMGTHMHYVGRDMRVSLERAAASGEPEQECLIETPQWNFNWQRFYDYDAEQEQLPSLQNGDKLVMHCQYDNTVQNRAVARALEERGLDAPIEVKLGEDTLDEMCVAALGIIQPNLQ
jgi:hypothetical protein